MLVLVAAGCGCVSPCCSHSGWFWTFVLVLVAAIVAGVDFVSPSCSHSGWLWTLVVLWQP